MEHQRPIVDYASPRPRRAPRDPLWWRIALATLCVILVAYLGLLLWGHVFLND